MSLKQPADGGNRELSREEEDKETNNEKFNRMLNRCKHPQRIYAALTAFIEPSVQESDDVFEKPKISIRNLFSGLNIP